jgi:hypothetical protein
MTVYRLLSAFFTSLAAGRPFLLFLDDCWGASVRATVPAANRYSKFSAYETTSTVMPSLRLCRSAFLRDAILMIPCRLFWKSSLEFLKSNTAWRRVLQRLRNWNPVPAQRTANSEGGEQKLHTLGLMGIKGELLVHTFSHFGHIG